MGQEDYLNSLLNAMVDSKEDSSNKEELDGDLHSEEEIREDIYMGEEEKPIEDIFFSEEEKEPLEDILASGEEEEPLEDIFAGGEEEESLGDIFASGEEEEALGDIFASGEEEESLGDIFASEEEEESMEDIFAGGEEEPLEDILASGEEEESLGDIFGSEEEEESLEDIFASEEEEEPLEDISFDEGELESAVSSEEIEESSLDINEEQETDLFSMLEEEETTGDLDMSDEEQKSLFDDDLMELLKEEDTSLEDTFATMDEAQAAASLGEKEVKSTEGTSEGKKAKKAGLFEKLFKGKESNESEEQVSKEKEEVKKDTKPKEKKKKEKKEKPKKEKKPKKVKPKKEKPKKPEIIEEPSPPLHKGQVIGVFVLCLSIGFFIIAGVKLAPYNISMTAAQGNYEREEYTKAYQELEGLDIKSADMEFYNKVKTIVLLENQLDTYFIYDRLGLKPEALNSLIKGVSNYDEFYPLAEQYKVTSNYDSMLQQIQEELNSKYGISIEAAREITMSETAQDYSTQLYSITN